MRVWVFGEMDLVRRILFNHHGFRHRLTTDPAAVIDPGRDRISSRRDTGQVPGDGCSGAYYPSASDGVVVSEHVILRIDCNTTDGNCCGYVASIS